MIAYTIAPALESGVFDVGDRLDRLGGDRGDRAALRRRGAVPAAGGVRRRHVARHRVGRAHARRAAARRAGAGTASACCGRPARSGRRTRSAARGRTFIAQDGRRFAARGREVHAASRARCGSCAASGCCRCCRSAHRPDAAVAQHAVPGAAAGLRAERVARDRLDARRLRAAHDRRRRAGAVPHRRLRRLRHQRPARLDDRRAADGRRRSADVAALRTASRIRGREAT